MEHVALNAKETLNMQLKTLQTNLAIKKIDLTNHKESAAGFSDPADSSEMNERFMREHTEIHRLTIRIDKTLFALREVANGDYGYCKNCGEEIPEKRLNLVPESTYCFDCLDILEYKQKVGVYC
ncbi:TraR/DksA family transcriptional regulator [Vibrio sp. SS-MA-C1-2]|uniref:TraR/DksA family transcriptional regulator n=1 Tax=Vibrio sp. SS-MA-C1-2 TaxID=2908646 RepID=UPI001F158660|nr:TraR/DksA family transcriptional regulator [Vibrio sp. SS-MA-C1-2]UJF17304.1 TraR/DksA family transcriptional regulator [Vibrio sp. SS-MA-C1-2]